MSNQRRKIDGSSSKPPQSIRERLPSVMGWLSQSNTFTALNKACKQGNEDSQRKIFIVKGKYVVLTSRSVLTAIFRS